MTNNELALALAYELDGSPPRLSDAEIMMALENDIRLIRAWAEMVCRKRGIQVINTEVKEL